MNKKIKKHIVDSTAILTVSHPVISGLQTIVAGVSTPTSIGNRLLTTALTYGGLGSVYSYLRDRSKTALGITQESSEWIHTVHGSLCNAAFNLVIAPPLLIGPELAMDRNIDWKVIGTATALQAAYGAISGIPIEYAIEIARDLTGIQESRKMPSLIKNKSSSSKKRIAAALIVASLGITSSIYTCNERPNSEFVNEVHQLSSYR